MIIEEGLIYLSSVDIKMKKLISYFPKPVFKSVENNFHSLVKYFVYQQLSGRVASVIFKRYKGLFRGKDYLIPNKVLEVSNDNLKAIGLSKQKILYIKNLAHTFVEDNNFSDFSDFSDLQIKDKLIKVKGIGPWTADMFLMFTLKRQDVIPFSDLGIRKGFKRLYNLPVIPDQVFMSEKSKIWSPFRTLASLYLWRLVDDEFNW